MCAFLSFSKAVRDLRGTRREGEEGCSLCGPSSSCPSEGHRWGRSLGSHPRAPFHPRFLSSAPRHGSELSVTCRQRPHRWGSPLAPGARGWRVQTSGDRDLRRRCAEGADARGQHGQREGTRCLSTCRTPSVWFQVLFPVCKGGPVNRGEDGLGAARKSGVLWTRALCCTRAREDVSVFLN